jgi:SAM-dependent methyltransferase
VSKLGRLVWELAPPIVRRTVRAARGGSEARQHGVKDAAWYDAAFEGGDHWRKHYTDSPYCFLWTVIADRIVQSGSLSVLDVGCGPGQLASVLRDKGIRSYCGLDFSPKRIEQARQVCPEFEFVVADAFATDLFERRDYDLVVTTEFLEHVEGDLELIGRIRSGTRVLGTVPNFPYVAHLRHFRAAEEVEARYAPVFKTLRVDTFLASREGKTFFLLDGATR